MKTLVIVCALVACCAASGSWGYSSIAASPLAYGYGIASYPRLDAATLVASRTIAAAPVVEAVPAYRSYAAPSLVAAAPAINAYATAPALSYGYGISSYPRINAATLVASRTIAAAPVVEAAPVVAAAPAIVEAAPAVAAVKTIAAAPIVAAAPAVVAPAVVKSQYHSQDELGQATYGHAEPLQAHNAVQDAHGNKVGSFSYFNPHDGQVHRTDYVADAHGYRVASNDLPIAARAKRSVLLETPASTVPLATPLYAAAPAIHAIAAPAAISAYSTLPALSAYSALPAALSAYSAAPALVAPGHAVRDAVLTEIVNNPGHAVSYRVD